MTKELLKFIESDSYQKESRFQRAIALLSYSLPERTVKTLLQTVDLKTVYSVCNHYGLNKSEIRKILNL